MAVTALPTPPSRSDPATFAARGDAFMSALPTFRDEINALQITTNAQTAADAAASATSAAEAVVAKNAAIAAWAASMSPAETLPAISKSLHIGAIVKAIVYDTSADSDGGAWRKRCADKSWYTEALGGDRWIGQYATISAAWTAAGSTTGAVYQASATAGAQTIGKYYTPTSSTTVTEVFRGVSREFPAVVGIVAESARVVIYDLSAVGCPMWMVFNTSYSTNPRLLIGTANTSVVAGQGKVFLGGGAFGVTIADFVADNGTRINATATYRFPALIAARNTEYSWPSLSSVVLVNSKVNDVALTVLDNAPIDAATGLPTPTIAVACGNAGVGGVSIIKDDGTVINSASTTDFNGVEFVNGRLRTSTIGAVRFALTLPITQMTAAWQYDVIVYNETASSLAMQNAYPAKIAGNARGSSLGLTRVKENPATPTKGMVSYITTAYNSGWMPGDIRGAYLADTTAETITASGELVTNGTFATDTSGWTAGSSSTLSVSSGQLVVTQGASNYGQATQTVTGLTIGKTYVFAGTVVAGTASICLVQIGGTTIATAAGSFVYSYTAVGSSALITLAHSTTANNATGTTLIFDNISVKLADPDRSVKNKGLVINGSLTKTAVASGAGLVAYSGFSGSNYLEQPYNSDLDFGTGDFCVMGWYNPTSLAATQCLFHRAITSGGILCHVTVTGALLLYATASTTFTAIVTTAAGVVVANTNQLVEFGRLSGTAYIRVNGVTVASAADTTNLTYASSVSRIGYRVSGTDPVVGSLALWRISATAPSQSQIEHIYRTELPLFQASAQCTIAGSSTAVTALAFDDTSELLHVGTSWGRTGFKDLLRVDSEATTTGALTSLSASQGVIITGGTSGKVYVPAMLLRDELRRKDEARKALGKVPVFFDYTATASQTAFVAPKGYTIKAVYHNGTLKRETTTGVYWTRSTDGFAETCTLSAGATVSDWISLMCVRT